MSDDRSTRLQDGHPTSGRKGASARKARARAAQPLGRDFAACGIVTYKVTACRADGSGESDGPVRTLHHATPLDRERYRHRVRQLNA